MVYNLTKNQKNILRRLVQDAEARKFNGEEFYFVWAGGVSDLLGYQGAFPQVSKSVLEELAGESLLRIALTAPTTYRCALTAKAYEAVDTDFGASTKDTPKAPIIITVKDERSQSVAEDPARVFVVHGRNEALRDALYSFLRALHLKPMEWDEVIRSTGKGSPFTGEVLESALGQVQAVVVLLSPDDLARLRDEFLAPDDQEYERKLTGQARPNVLFEAGMAFGRHPDRTILVEVGILRPFSDVGGRHTVRFDGSSKSRHRLAERLETAGCSVSRTGTDWLSAGDFAVEAIGESELERDDQTGESTTQLQDEITLLKREKEELEEKLAGLRMQGMSGIEDLAHGSEIFELRYRSTDEYQNREHEGTEEISWNDLLKIIGPRMLVYIRSETMKEIIESHLKNKLWSEPHLMELKIYGPFIDDSDFDTIKIQLRELGLTERHPSSDAWKLTEYGDRLLAKLMSIRKKEK